MKDATLLLLALLAPPAHAELQSQDISGINVESGLAALDVMCVSPSGEPHTTTYIGTVTEVRIMQMYLRGTISREVLAYSLLNRAGRPLLEEDLAMVLEVLNDCALEPLP